MVILMIYPTPAAGQEFSFVCNADKGCVITRFRSSFERSIVGTCELRFAAQLHDVRRCVTWGTDSARLHVFLVFN